MDNISAIQYEPQVNQGLPSNILSVNQAQLSCIASWISKFPNERSEMIRTNALGLAGFISWLRRNNDGLDVDDSNASIYTLSLAQLINSVINIEIGDFSICLLVKSLIVSDKVELPRAVLDLPKFTPHFIVLVEVCEEGFVRNFQGRNILPQVKIHGFWQYNRLCKERDLGNVPVNENWTYSLPLSLCNFDLNLFVLYLKTFPANLMKLPANEKVSSLEMFDFSVQNKWKQKLQHLTGELWKWTSWSEFSSLLHRPRLLEYLFGSSFDVLLSALSWDEVMKTRNSPYGIPYGSTDTFSIDLDDVRRSMKVLLRKGFDIPDSVDKKISEIKFDLCGLSFKATILTWYSQCEDRENLTKTFIITFFRIDESIIHPDVKMLVERDSEIIVEKLPKDSSSYLLAAASDNENIKFSVKLCLKKEEIKVDPFDPIFE